MIRSLKAFAAAALMAFGFSLPAHAVTSGVDFTDLWWNPAEPGWGLNVIHQNGNIFATLYVYDASGTAHFYSASNTGGSGNSFSGPLYETHGTYFGTNPYAGYNLTQVGTLSLSFSTSNSGTLNYNVGAVSVSKAITRFAFGMDNLSGNYLGGLTASSICGGQSQLTLMFDTMSVSQSGSTFNATVNFYNSAGVQSQCVFNGTYSPMGRLGNIAGSYHCTFGGQAGNAGNFAVTNVQSSATGFSGNFSGSDQFCSSHNGYFGGVHDVI